MDGRKIISELENPIDNILIILSIKFGDILHKYKFITPNIITTISIILSIIAIYFIYIKYYKIGAILFFISYFFDCLDGNFARRFNMVTTFGDYYDHIGDIFKYLLLIYVILISNLNSKSEVVRSKEFLRGAGFNFNQMTSFHQIEGANTAIIFDLGYQMTEKGNYRILRCG